MKYALITGASGGIGSAAAHALHAEGYSVIAGFRNCREKAEELAGELGGIAVHIDLSRPETLSEAVSGLPETDILVNNGGSEHIGLFQDMTAAELMTLMNTDLVGTMELTRLILPQMLHRHSGCIVNIASVWGEVGASCEVAYSAAKAGVIGFTKALAKEVAPSGIRVNCVSPGFIDTRMNSQLSDTEREALINEIPMNRAGTPEEVAHAIAFLCSENSAYITGQTLRIDGAWN